MKKIIVLATTVFIFIPSFVFAADVPNRGISLSPGSFEEWMAVGETKQETLFITNNTGADAIFIIETEDFEASSDPRISTQLLGGNKSDYSLKDYLKSEVNEINIENGQTVPFKVSISIPTGITSPGLYGAVLVRQNVAQKTNESTGIIPRVGALFYVGIKGNFPRGSESMDLKYIPFDQICSSGECSSNQDPYNKFEVSFQNGNKVHLSLSGNIEVDNVLGKKIDTVKVSPWYVMADTTKIKDFQWKSPQSLFGLYKATVKLSDFNYSDLREKSIYFWVLPWQMIVVIILVSILVFLLLKFIFRKLKQSKMPKKEGRKHSKLKTRK